MASMPIIEKSLCQSCQWMRLIVSSRGSQFLLCQKSQTDVHFAKYPPQPIARCPGYEPAVAQASRLPQMISDD
jgi:hypothetical protein